MKIKIWLIRHGMTEGNRQQRYVGTTDELLCEEGRQQIILKRQLIKSDQDIQNVYVSPMLRCRETAEILFPAVSQITEAGFGSAVSENLNTEIIRNSMGIRIIRHG